MLDNVPKNISAMLPDHIVDDYPLFTEFLTAYYAFLNQPTGPDNVVKNILSYTDIDDTIDSFRDHIYAELLTNIPDTIIADRTLLAKHIKELYSKKGTEDSYRLLFRILFDKEIEINYPVEQILMLSDGRWDQKTSFICHIPTTVADTLIKTAIGRKVVVQLALKVLPVTILDIVKLNSTDANNNLYEFFIIRDFFDDFNTASTVSFKQIDSITITNHGSGYDADADIINVISLDGGRTDIDIVTVSGEITNTIIIDKGIGFTIPPILAIESETGSGGYLVATLSNIYTGTILNSISNIKILKSATGYNEGSAYEVDYKFSPDPDQLGRGARIQITHNDSLHYTKNISILDFGQYYQDKFDFVINKTTATAYAIVTVSLGSINSVVVINNGSGYTVAPTITIYGDGQNATMTCTIDANGTVDACYIGNVGEGYSIPPAIVFSDASIAINFSNSKLRTYPGSYIENNGFSSSSMVIYDGIYYQKYSYEIVINELFDLYRGALKKMLHPAGYAAWGVYDFQKVLNVQLSTEKIDIERNSKILDFVYAIETHIWNMQKVLADTYDSSTVTDNIDYDMQKVLADTYDSSTVTDNIDYDMQKVLADISTIADVNSFSMQRGVADILSSPITYNPLRIYVVSGYVADGYVKESELTVTFGKILADISDSSLYVEAVDIVKH